MQISIAQSLPDLPKFRLRGFYSAYAEGWALYWELLLYDMKFQKTPEDRVGALFWRMKSVLSL